jgi:hypothetical protein
MAKFVCHSDDEDCASIDGRNMKFKEFGNVILDYLVKEGVFRLFELIIVTN